MHRNLNEKIHVVRNFLDIEVQDFNEWLKKEFGASVVKLPDEQFQEVMDKMKVDFGGQISAPKTLDSDSLLEAVEEEAPESPAPEPSKAKSTRKRGVICFYMTDIRSAFKMYPFINYFLEGNQNVRLLYQFGFNLPGRQDKVRYNFINENFRKSGRMHPFMRKDGTISEYEHVDLLVTTDPGDKNNKLFPAKATIAVQTNPIENIYSIGRGIRKVDKYFAWSKKDKMSLRTGGADGSRIKILGSLWLTHLGFQSASQFPSKSAALFVPDPKVIPTQSYWSRFQVIKILCDMGYDPHIIRWRGQQTWQPKEVKIVKDCISEQSRNWYPSVAVVAPGMPCEDAIALKVPILRMKYGQVITPSYINSARLEQLPEGKYIDSMCLKSFSAYVREYAGLSTNGR